MQDLAVVGLLAPRLRETRIALEVETVAIASDGDHDLRAFGPPLNAKSRIDQPSAQESPALLGSSLIYSAADSPVAVSAPRPSRLFQCRDTENLAAKGTAAAGPAGQRLGGRNH